MEHNAASGPSRVSQRLNQLFLGVPVFLKVMGIALGMAVMLGVGMLWQIHETWHGLLVRDLERRGQRFVGEVAVRCAELVRARRGTETTNELSHSLSEAPDVAYVILQDKDGTVLAEAWAPGHARDAPEIRELTRTVGDGPHQLRVGMSMARVGYEVNWLTRRLAGTTAIIALLGMLAAWRLTRLFAQPIEELVTLTRSVKAGHYQAKAPVRASDEVGELAAAFNEMTEAVAQKEAARQQLLRQVIRAGEEERKRVARELHDQTGQALTSLIAGLGALEGEDCHIVHSGRIAELRSLAEYTLAGVHDLSVALRPSVLDDVGLMAALERHCRTFGQRFGVEVICSETGLGDQRLPAEVELTIYRVVQEALTNAVRHGQAGRVRALVQCTDTGVLTMVQDNGCGFDSDDWRERCVRGNHLGLLGIEERVTLLGGSFCVESKLGQGTTVYADIPGKEQS
jgi:signal transduction histidine kinase